MIVTVNVIVIVISFVDGGKEKTWIIVLYYLGKNSIAVDQHA